MHITTDIREEFNATVACNADQALTRRARRILIVDDDLGFLLWLSKTLVEAGYAAFPAGTVENATALAKHLSDELEVLVVNPRIKQAPELVRWLRSCHPGLKVIALRDTGETTLPVTDDSLQKDSQGADIVHLVEHVLAPETVPTELQMSH